MKQKIMSSRLVSNIRCENLLLGQLMHGISIEFRGSGIDEVGLVTGISELALRSKEIVGLTHVTSDAEVETQETHQGKS